MARVKRCSKCERELSESEFYNRKACTDGKAGQCKACWEDAWGREGWEMITVPTAVHCDYCPFEAECKHNIWKRSFDPYCFVEAKYHGLYVREYAG
jgi:hypothetical protein